MTRYAQIILDTVLGSCSHMTAEQVFERLKKTCPGVALATVYNNLNRLCGEGLIRRISVSGMPDRFDRAERHDHLVCGRCGRLTDINLPDLTRLLEGQAGVPLLDYDLKLVYLCKECAGRAPKSGAR